MQLKRIVATAVLVCLAAPGLLAQKQVAFIATVTPVNGREVSTLMPGDVKVVESDKPLNVSKVEVIERVPKLQLLIDNGVGFPSQNLGDLRNGIKALVNNLPLNLEVTMVTTAPNPRVLEKATTDRVKQLAAIDRIVPDSGSGKFTESLWEATERIEKDKDEKASYTIVTIGTTQGDLNVRDDDVKKIFERVTRRHIPVFVILFSTLQGSTTGGVQQDVGGNAAAMGGGRMEVINSATRLTSLLPELGKLLQVTMGPDSHLVRVFVDRPGGGKLGEIGMQMLGMNVVTMTLDAVNTK